MFLPNYPVLDDSTLFEKIKCIEDLSVEILEQIANSFLLLSERINN